MAKQKTSAKTENSEETNGPIVLLRAMPELAGAQGTGVSTEATIIDEGIIIWNLNGVEKLLQNQLSHGIKQYGKTKTN